MIEILPGLFVTPATAAEIHETLTLALRSAQDDGSMVTADELDEWQRAAAALN
jgi:hypothetical protein